MSTDIFIGAADSGGPFHIRIHPRIGFGVGKNVRPLEREWVWVSCGKNIC